ncbi:GNAT family N-acetyltransferase [Jeongeupia chitinilytica]|uniref:N-acetyltransferase GCN5 n=1 Tax=Jeongeupia chitinilytica TaxID=1041641 RepID=A0ABQ3GYG2_9NEIS|nr:GNAT family N-acetyltransferase [Jeongeupia chitinilytica]GHD61064.1 N-acetyltransferase GCN5 [Jeongeupia chitinilytica]
MLIRETRADDLPALFVLRGQTRDNALTPEELAGYGITPESSAAAMQRGEVKGWLCEIDGRIVGFASGDRDGGEMLVLALLPDFEGRGIGKALLGCVVAWLQSLGHARIWLVANPDPKVRAHGFYRRCGWVATGEMINGEEVMEYRGS